MGRRAALAVVLATASLSVSIAWPRVPLSDTSSRLEGFALPSGRVLLSHGADPFLGETQGVSGDDSSVFCAPRSEPHFEVVVARAFDDRDRSLRDLVEPMRQAVLDASENMDVQARILHPGSRARYRILCDRSARVAVAREVLYTPKRLASFRTIASELEDRGYDRRVTKYIVFYDDCIVHLDYECFAGGLGSIDPDDRLTARNRNTRGGDFGVSFSDGNGLLPQWNIVLHESGHNMGAVQESAPHNSGGSHCWDGVDVMCYADGGYNGASYQETSCPGLPRGIVALPIVYRWDCNGDDYFNPSPPAQSYLADHWNVASRFNRYLDHD